MPSPIRRSGRTEALLARLAAAADPELAVAAFETAFFAVPAFEGAALPAAAAGWYDRANRPHPARLLRGLAQALQPDRAAGQPAAEIVALLAHPRPSVALLHRLETLDVLQDAPAAAALFEAALPHLPPLDEYWVHYRMALVYRALGQADAAFLLASVALQLEPWAPESERPARLVAERLLRLRAWPELAALEAGWRAANPDMPLLDPGELAAVPAGIAPATAGRRDRGLMDAEWRPAQRIAVAGRGLPAVLAPLLQPLLRPAIGLAELEDAELLVADGAVAVLASDGTPQPDLSVGLAPALLADLLERRREPLAERDLAAAILIGDVHAAPNLCHFLLDHATRLALYSQAGIDLADTCVIGPDLARPYQHEIARRLGARRYIGTTGCARIRVRHLAVTSNCHQLRHTAHFGAAWALAAVRAGFAELIDARRHRRLLISRADAPSRRLLDEAAALAALQPHGFERFVPATVPLSEQVRAFAAATHVVAPHGAALANLAFCAPGTRVLEVFHPHYGTSAYAMLAPALRLDYAAMVGLEDERRR